MLELRPYQQKCIEAIKLKKAEGKYRQLISLPTGTGKTVVFSHLIADMKCSALVFAHTGELLDQAAEKIKMICPQLSVGIVNGTQKQFNAQVVICSIQAAGHPKTLNKLIEKNFELLIYDESQHSATDHAREILDQLGFGKDTSKLLVGCTATGFRQDGKGLGEIFDAIAYERNTKEMIDDGWLCPPRAFKIKTDLDLSKVEKSKGDFKEASLAEIMNTPEMNSAVVDAFEKNAKNRKTIAFGVSVQHAKDLSKEFIRRGIKSSVVYGDMPCDERAATIKAYRNGEIQVLCNCQVLTEGFDCAETDCVIVARPTKSRGLYQQMVGRGLRLYPNKKDCIVLDFGDVNHNICGVAVLYKDFGDDESTSKSLKEKERELSIPPKLDQELKMALVNYDPLGESFAWEKEGKTHVIKGNDGIRVELKLQDTGRYHVVYSTPLEQKFLAKNLTFEYSFSVAESFAKKYRRSFMLNDLEAPWRKKPISNKQIKVFQEHGYKNGIEQLNSGQASILIAKGMKKIKGL